MAFTQGHALIIGVGEYTHHPEANIPLAAGDAGEVARVLVEKKSCGYLPGRVCLLTNQSATRGAVLQALADLSGAGPEDTVFLFYSGHGAPGTDGNYHLSTCDTHFSDGKIKDFALSEGELLGLLRGIPARRMVLLIQACYSGELSPHFGPEAPAAVESAGLPDRTADAILGSGEGRIIITSSRASQRSWGRAAEKTSLFARALVDGLRGEGWVANNAGFIGAFGLYEYVHETVKEAARAIGQEQEPVLSALELVGPFPLALYHGASDQGEYDPAEPLPGDAPVRRVSEKISRRLFERRVVYTNGGPYFEKVSTGGGEFAQKLNKLQADTISGGIQAVGDGIVIYPPADPEEAARKLREKNRQAYLEGLYAACQEMRFAPLGGDDSELVDFTLNDVYIELDTETPVVQKGDSAGGRGLDVPGTLLVPRGKNEAVFSALEVAARHKRLALLGDPGSGKSTFAHRLLSWLAASALGRIDGPAGFEPDLTPVLVTLRHLAARLNTPGLEDLPAADRNTRLLQALREQVTAELRQMDLKPAACDYGPELLEVLEGGRCLLVLDGLDEVPFEMRVRIRQAAVAAIRRCRLARVIVTCRIRSYSGDTVFKDFAAHTLAPLDGPKIKKFCRDWYETQVKYRKISSGLAGERIDDLVSAAEDPELQDMPSNPMLLTCLAILHQTNTRLPRERVKLLARVVDLLILRWQKEKSGRQAASPALLTWLDDSKRLRPALDRLGYEAHQAGDDLPRWKAQQTLEAYELMGSPHLAIEFLDYADQRAGILAGYGGEEGGPAASYRFPHRLLQEYLAGCYLFSGRDLAGSIIQHSGQGDGWDLAVQLGMEELCFNEPRQGPNALLSLAYQLCSACAGQTAPEQRALLWAGQIAALLGTPLISQDTRFPNGGKTFVDRMGKQLIEVMGGSLPPVERSEAGNALARLGDPRPEVMTVERMALCYVPGGRFVMGSREGEQANGDEKPQHEVSLSYDFWIGYFPVTNAQFDAFASAGGYANAAYWEPAIQAGFWKDGLFQGRHDNQGRSGRIRFRGAFDLPNHPTVGVSWYESLAFAQWLDELAHRRGWLDPLWRVSLPSEAEWEKAARGGQGIPQPAIPHGLDRLENSAGVKTIDNVLDQRAFPWGDTFDPGKANTDESGIGSTSAVGCFPGGASPYGIQDMAGNVWEWTRSLWGKDFSKAEWEYPYNPEERQRENMQAESNILRVLRGGSWNYNQRYARCAFRNWYFPSLGSLNLGFRVVVLPSSTLKL